MNWRLHLNETTEKQRKLITLALRILFRDRRTTTEKRTNPVAKKTVTMKMRNRARFRKQWK